jgi:quercetin 2,3-dioxygenase
MNTRKLQQVIRSIPTSDGAGVKLRRSLGQAPSQRLDPFLMLDEFSSENADDYIAGFPDHPHRGFETVTYMLDGHMLHAPRTRTSSSCAWRTATTRWSANAARHSRAASASASRLPGRC